MKGNTMKNEKDLINTVAQMYSLATSDLDHYKLAKFILANYYSVESFFLNNENDFSSGLNLNSVETFIDNMKKVVQAVNGEL